MLRRTPTLVSPAASQRAAFASGSLQRAKALHSFTGKGGPCVFLLSMRCASVGLTLTAASRLFMMEPSTSLAQEQQAIGRVHRVGQTRPVTVVRYVLRETVEERILRMHDEGCADPPPSTSPGGGEGPSAASDEASGDEASPVAAAGSSSSILAVRPATAGAGFRAFFGAASGPVESASEPAAEPTKAQQALDVAMLCRLLE
jgi:hypothetical protein